MYIENIQSETVDRQMAGKPNNGDSADARSARERGAAFYGKTKTAVSDAYSKTSHAAGATYAQVKSYSGKNPGKTLIVALGLGAGVGFLLGANTHRMRAGRNSTSVVKALSNIAMSYFR